MDEKIRVLLADDDTEFCARMSAVLDSADDFELVGIAENGEKALSAVNELRPDVLIIELMLPVMDGWSVCAKIRETSKVPIIMLTAKGTEYDKVVGLDGGADDYVAKPFGMMELLSRIRALLRRTETEDGTLRCGILEVDPGQHIVRVRGQETILTQKEFEVLCLLLRNPGQVLSREQLIENVWGYAFTGESRTVDVHVRRLREKIEPSPSDPKYVHTKWGVGYYFRA